MEVTPKELFAKIGELTVRLDLLEDENMRLRAAMAEREPEVEAVVES